MFSVRIDPVLVTDLSTHPGQPDVDRALRRAASLILDDLWPLSLCIHGAADDPLCPFCHAADLALAARLAYGRPVELHLLAEHRSAWQTVHAFAGIGVEAPTVSALWQREPMPIGTLAHQAWLAGTNAMHACVLAHLLARRTSPTPSALLPLFSEASARVSWMRSLVHCLPAMQARN